MRPLTWVGIGLAGAVLAAAAGADAETASGSRRMPCHDAQEIARQLGAKYAEAPIAFGLQSNGNLLQVYASGQQGTWTVVSTTPNGVSCIVAAGRQWESRRVPRPTGPVA
jgi:hypothetical protein